MKHFSQLISKLFILFFSSSLVGCQLNNTIDEKIFCCRHYTYTKITDYKNNELKYLTISGEDFYPDKGKEATFIEFHYDGTFIQKTTFKSNIGEKSIIYTTSGSYYQKEYKFYLTSSNNVSYYGIDRPTEIDDESNVNNVTTLKVQVLDNNGAKIDNLYIWYYDGIYHGCDY